MPYDVEWLDEGRRLLKVTLSDPLDMPDAQALIDEIRPLIEAPRPIFVLADVRSFNVQSALSRFMGLVGRQPFPRTTAHLEQSRAAVVGGGPVVATSIGMVEQFTGRNLMRAFDDDRAALAWLEEQAGEPA